MNVNYLNNNGHGSDSKISDSKLDNLKSYEKLYLIEEWMWYFDISEAIYQKFIQQNKQNNNI